MSFFFFLINSPPPSLYPSPHFTNYLSPSLFPPNPPPPPVLLPLHSCTGTAAVTWSNTPIGVCTPAVGNPALNLLLAPTVIITNVYLGASATCTGKGELTAPIVAGTAPVGASPVCTNADTYSVSVVAVAGGGYTIQAFGAPNCASAALGATWTKAALNSCVPASSGGLTIFVGSQGTVPFTPSSASSTTSTPSALELGLGIGLGVGIPVVVALVFLARCYLCTVKAPAPPAPAAPAGLEKPTEVVIRTVSGGGGGLLVKTEG